MLNKRLDSTASSPVFITWRDSYSVGNDELDAHHKTIIAMIDELFLATQQGTDALIVDAVLNRMADYAEFHFAREEELMELHQFPGLSDHKDKHRRLVGDLNDLRSQNPEHGAVTGNDLLRLLKRWWLYHISGVDKQYSSYLSPATVG